MSVSAAAFSENVYGLGSGRGDIEEQVIRTLRDWIVPYVADYERQNELNPRTLPVPPTPESIHGGIDFVTFSAELFPELIVVVQPTGPVERYGEDGTYGQWFSVDVAAIVTVEGDQNLTRGLADAYGEILQKLIPQQGAFGFKADGVSDFAVRTRLESAYSLEFQDETVRDIMRATVMARTFIEDLVSDYEGPRVPPVDPYAVPIPLPLIDRVEVDLLRGTPDDFGIKTADGVVLDGTVYPPVVRHIVTTVNEPSDNIPEPTD